MGATGVLPCAERVFADRGFNHWCSRDGTKLEDGRWWCYQHAPYAIAKRREKAHARYEAESRARREQYRRQTAERDACMNISTEALEAGVVKGLVEAARDLVAVEACAFHPNSEPCPVEDLRAVLAKLTPVRCACSHPKDRHTAPGGGCEARATQWDTMEPILDSVCRCREYRPKQEVKE